MHSSPPEDPPLTGGEEDPNDGLTRAVATSDDEEEKLEQLVELLPPERRHELLEVVQASFHKGWLPPPDVLAAYNQILPGLAERIVFLPEREQAHRHKYLDNESERQFKLRRYGQNYALAGMALLLAFSVFLALIGEPVWAAKVAIGTIVAVVGIFVTGKVADVQAAKAEQESEE